MSDSKHVDQDADTQEVEDLSPPLGDDSSQDVTDVTEVGGNTAANFGKSSGKVKKARSTSQYRNWCFTYYPDVDKFTTEQVKSWLNGIWDRKHVDFAVVQEEKCPKTGRVHWQGVVSFKERVTIFSPLTRFVCALRFCFDWLALRATPLRPSDASAPSASDVPCGPT